MPVAESLGLAALGWVLSPVVKDLISKGTSYLGTDIGEGLEDLETTLLPQLSLMLRAAENSPHKVELAKWLARLKNAYYDAEAILHDLEYESLKHKAKSQSRKRSVNQNISFHSFIQPLVKFTGKMSKKITMLSPEKRELWHRLNNLKKIAAEAKTFHKLLGIPAGNGTTNVCSRPTTSSHRIHKVFGLDGQRDSIISFLLDEQGGSSLTSSYSIVAITGIGGAGKTTLAQYVYNDEKVKRHFESRMMWLSLSQNKTIEERTKQMIECLTREGPNLNSLQALQDKLIEALPESKGVLLVLDDVWYDTTAKEKQWDDRLVAPFASKGENYKIIVTSRSTSLPIALQPDKHIELDDMAPNDFKSLLRYYAIDGLNISNPQLENDLWHIGEKIADIMSRSPLAATVVGNELRNQLNKKFWQATLYNVNLSSTNGALLWSYQCMDGQLQRCFLFCAIFPRGTWFTGNDLVLYWVALDFIQSSDDNRTLEDIGSDYFQIMVRNSIFQLVDGKYFMHDLFRDLADNLSGQDCFRVTNFEREIPLTTLHMHLKVNIETLKENKPSLRIPRNLRALLVDIPFNTVEDVNELISMVSANFKHLRVLNIWSTGYKTVPDVVGDLRNLRCLNIWHSSIEKLPDSVSRLYHLQYLILPTSVKVVPTKLSDLINLRSICIYDDMFNPVNFLPPVPYLGKLTSLQHLGEFHVRKEEGYELQQLGSLSKIGGTLKIVNLENVKHKDEAVKAKLVEKINLERLELIWADLAEIASDSAETVSDLEVIEALQPPQNLEVLSIEGYRNSSYPTWLGEGSPIVPKIKFLGLFNCGSLMALPPILNQSSNLHQLIIENMGHIKKLSNLPESLCELHISKCQSLIFVCEDEQQLSENIDIMEANFFKPYIKYYLPSSAYPFNDIQVLLSEEVKIFKQTVSIETCSEQLQIVEGFARDNTPQQWENVIRAWWNCHQQRLNFMFCTSRKNRLHLPTRLCSLNLSYCLISDEALSDCLRGMANLKDLYLEGIMTITTLPPEVILQSMQNLRVLKIKHCWCLRSLGGLHALAKLERFGLKVCWGLEMNCDFTRLPLTLQSFSMRYCVVPGDILMGDLLCLKKVKLLQCQVSGTILFGKLTSLKSLILVNCPQLSSIEGFKSRLFFDNLCLVGLPMLDVESVLKTCKGCRNLYISSLEMLNKILVAEKFAPQSLTMYHQDDDITFEKSHSLQSIKSLSFAYCETKNLPKSLCDFSTLDGIYLENCENISALPELPDSVNYIEITRCPVLRERCQPNGPDWHKIQRIHHRYID